MCLCVCVCVGGGGCRHNSTYVLMFNFFFPLFIQNIPKRSNCIMKYLDSHLYMLVDL